MVLTVRPGSGGYATLSGFQIAGAAPTNHAPVALAQNLSVNQGDSAGIALAGTDADGDPLTFTISSMPSHGSLSGTPPNITYSPLPGFSGIDAFRFKANDGKIDSLDATVAINVGASATGRLLSVDFGAGSTTSETGPAAVGQSSNDFWNFYTRDDGQGGWLNSGALQNLKYSDGTPSTAGLTVANAPGAWGNGSSDAMYNSYIYPFSGNATVTVTNLGLGTFDLYVYGIDAQYQLSVGALDCGIKTTTNAPIVNPLVWHEGEQYVVFRGLQITNAADAVTITVQPGISGYAIISGVQLNSGDGMATNTTMVTNSAPVARATVLNALTSSDGDTNIVVVSANGTNAQVILDASLCTDADNDALTYSWLEESLVPFATGVTVTNTLDIGSHTVTLLVNDGRASSSATLEFEVITVPDAMVELAVTVEKSDLDRATKRQLESVLIDNSQNSDLSNLDAFLAKVQSYVAPTKPQSAAVLNSAAQKLIDSASKP
jgi:Big-like domain-containing protein